MENHLSTKDMPEYALWHVFVVDNDGREKYRGSRCDEQQADVFCLELKSGVVDEQDWRNAYWKHSMEVHLPVYSSQRSSADLANEQRTAMHEAGHAVAAIQLGVDGQDYGSITIIPEGRMSGSFSMRKMCTTQSEAQRDLIISCAGYGALRAAGYTEKFACTGCGDDFNSAEALIENWSLPSLDHWKKLATHLLSLPENARAVKAVADSLIQHKTLGPAYTEIKLMAAIGIQSPSGTEHFKKNCNAQGLAYWLQ